MTRCVLLISKIANDARTAGLEPELMKGAVTPEPQGVLFKKKKKWGERGVRLQALHSSRLF